MSRRPVTEQRVLFAKPHLSVRAILQTRRHDDGAELEVGFEVGERVGWLDDTDAARLAFALLRNIPAHDDPNDTRIDVLLDWLTESVEGAAELRALQVLADLIGTRIHAAAADHAQAQATIRSLSEQRRAFTSAESV